MLLNRWVKKCISFLILISMLSSNVNLLGASQDSGEFYLERAKLKYQSWDVAGAIVNLDKALAYGLKNKSHQVEAYKLLAFCHAENQDTKKAVETYRKLLEVDPKFRLDSSVSPTFQQPFEIALNSHTKTPQIPEKIPEKGKSKKWLLIGASGLVGIGAAFLLINKGSEPGVEENPINKLIDPPYPPNSDQ